MCMGYGNNTPKLMFQMIFGIKENVETEVLKKQNGDITEVLNYNL